MPDKAAIKSYSQWVDWIFTKVKRKSALAWEMYVFIRERKKVSFRIFETKFYMGEKATPGVLGDMILEHFKRLDIIKEEFDVFPKFFLCHNKEFTRKQIKESFSEAELRKTKKYIMKDFIEQSIPPWKGLKKKSKKKTRSSAVN